jgi:hypothetical protein
MTCTGCHTGISGYPHGGDAFVACSACHSASDPNAEVRGDLPYDSHQQMSDKLNEACRSCHAKEMKATNNGMHAEALALGNPGAPMCTDCHGSHDVMAISDDRADSTDTCASCHSAIVSTYQASVHGTAIGENGSADAPTCGDCHGNHEISGPRQTNFGQESVALCNDCHLDKEIIERSSLAVYTGSAHIDDYHNTPISALVDLDSQNSSGKTVLCYDCHGVHNIQKADKANSTVNEANLLATCQKCHPDAGEGLLSAGVGHTLPDAQAPALRQINTIFGTAIPIIFGTLLIYMALDARKRWAEKRKNALSTQLEK